MAKLADNAAPKAKKLKAAEPTEPSEGQKNADISQIVPLRCLIRLENESGETLGDAIELDTDTTQSRMQNICSALMKQAGHDELDAPCAFYVEQQRVRTSLKDAIYAAWQQTVDFDLERVLRVVYEPQALWRVHAVTRCTASLPGHAQPVIAAQFSPDGRELATGSGDKTVRLWDLNTELPKHTCTEHTQYVLCIQWSPCGRKIASACHAGEVRIHDARTGAQLGKTLKAHKQWITSLSWEPLHVSGESRHVASAGKDGTVRIWDTVLSQCVRTLSSHTACVTCVRWGGEGLLYSASQDRSLKVWRVSDGVMCRTLSGHGHWVNTMALHTDYVLRTGAYEPKNAQQAQFESVADLAPEIAKQKAKKRYDALMAGEANGERLVSGSDDFTLFLWNMATGKKPVARMTGHMQLVNQVVFSCDGRRIASASFDKSVKLWDGRTGAFLRTLHGHVQAVYQVAWSSDSRMLVSGSKDSTLKVWDAEKGKLAVDLPGHGDEVYAVDWSPDGQRVASGGKDNLLRIWRR